MAVLHQPRIEIFEQFTEVLLLGPGGRVVFQGDPNRVVEYLQTFGYEMRPGINPADFALDIIADPEKAEQLCQAWTQAVKDDKHLAWAAASKAEVVLRPCDHFSPRERPDMWLQFKHFFHRALLLQLKAWRSFVLDLFLVLLGGTFLGGIYMHVTLEKVQPMNNLAALVVGLTSMLSALRVFGMNRVVFWRESASGINRFSYFMAEMTAHIPYLILAPVLFLSIFYSLASPQAPMRTYYLAVFGAVVTASGMGYIVSILVEPRNAQMTAVVVCLICGMLAGSNPTLPKLQETAVGPALYSLSFARYMLEILFLAESQRYPDIMLPQTLSMMQVSHGRRGESVM